MATKRSYACMLEGEIFEVAVRGSSRRFKIHESLLETKGGNIKPKNFQEGRSRFYEFEDTSEATIVRFIEWAYKDDYTGGPTIPQHLDHHRDDGTEAEHPKPSEGQGIAPSLPEASSRTDDRELPLVGHAYVYIFADTYGIDGLKSCAFTKLMAELKEVGNPPHRLETLLFKQGPRAVNPFVLSVRYLCRLYELCFGGSLPDDDPLLDDLGQFAAWRIYELRKHPSFRSILPQMSNHVSKFVFPGRYPPWDPDKSQKGAQKSVAFVQDGEFQDWQAFADQLPQCPDCMECDVYCNKCFRELVALSPGESA